MNDGPFRIERVDVDDPRAVELHGVLDADLDERYRDTDADDTPALAAKRGAALAVHPNRWSQPSWRWMTTTPRSDT